MEPSRSGAEEKEARQASLKAAAAVLIEDKPMASPGSSNEMLTDLTKEILNSLSQKLASPNHSSLPSSKEPLLEIVKELLAQKHLREKEELLAKQQKKLDSLMLKKEKFLMMEAAAKRRMASEQAATSEGSAREESGEEQSPAGRSMTRNLVLVKYHSE